MTLKRSHNKITPPAGITHFHSTFLFRIVFIYIFYLFCPSEHSIKRNFFFEFLTQTNEILVRSTNDIYIFRLFVPAQADGIHGYLHMCRTVFIFLFCDSIRASQHSENRVDCPVIAYVTFVYNVYVVRTCNTIWEFCMPFFILIFFLPKIGFG